jgi:hypothetical protein
MCEQQIPHNILVSRVWPSLKCKPDFSVGNTDSYNKKCFQ